jgi:ribonucleoside-diphosphate reductase alpha chain
MLSKTATEILKRRYLQPGETFHDLCSRVAWAVAGAEEKYGDDVNGAARSFLEVMHSLDFLPNSPTLMNAGLPLGMLSACFVLPVEDSMNSIFTTLRDAALIHKSGGGTGFSFSRLRPKGDAVGSTGGIASGPVSFISAFDAATETIKQGGKRRGANMASLRVDHPDIIDFIHAKADTSKLHNFNISVAVTDEFMRAALDGRDYELRNPHTGEVVAVKNAGEILCAIAEQAHNTGEPGLLFIDRINATRVLPELGEIETTNPCGEASLLPYESCNLGSINLSNMVGKSEINYDKLGDTVRTAVRFLDDVIDINRYPLPQIEVATKRTRKIGLGVMGFHDMLIKLGVKYSSEEARDIARDVMRYIRSVAVSTSIDLGSERGYVEGLDRRNAILTAIAPTGTISTFAGCSYGIEPIFAPVYERRIMDSVFFEVHPVLTYMVGNKLSDGDLQKIAVAGSLDGIDKIPSDIKDLFETAHSIPFDVHVQMQAAFQQHTDNAVSKTINLPHNATVEDVKDAYKLAYMLGCKGITVYRDGCREGQVYSTVQQQPAPIAAHERPAVVSGSTHKIDTGCGALYVTVNDNPPSHPIEVFATIGKAGGCVASQSEAIGRLASLALRHGVPVADIIRQLAGISCHRPAGFGENKVLSCADGIAKALRLHTDVEVQLPVAHDIGACPECGAPITHEGGCSVCKSCGYSACG